MTENPDSSSQESPANVDVVPGITEEEDMLRIETLLAKFKMFGECEPPLLETISAGSGLPFKLQTMMSKSGYWHSQEDSYNVYGLNIGFRGNDKKIEIFGNVETMKEWEDEHPSPNCAMGEWKYMGACSEFDYLFVNTNPSSTEFGATRCIVNNCFEDMSFLPAPFENFFDLI